jgi:hypothetical protein
LSKVSTLRDVMLVSGFALFVGGAVWYSAALGAAAAGFLLMLAAAKMRGKA